jgi:signal transduction histidine kinase
MADGPKLPGAAFDHGFHQGRRSVPADELADKARTLRRQLKIGFGESRDLAKLDPPPDLQKAVAKDRKHLTTALKAHELGATLRDLDQAARQAQHVVTAMKQLGASARLREETVHINQSLKVALTITDVPRRGVDTRWAPTSEPILNANEGELVQIWSNLIKNACDAMKEHQAATGRAPVLTVESALDEAQGWVDVRISDNGPGIPESIRARMFEPNVTTKKRGLDFGLGLGLAIVQRLVTIYQGRIDCDTGPDGTTFTISLPLTRH